MLRLGSSYIWRRVLIDTFRYFGRTYCLHSPSTRWIYYDYSSVVAIKHNTCLRIQKIVFVKLTPIKISDLIRLLWTARYHSRIAFHHSFILIYFLFVWLECHCLGDTSCVVLLLPWIFINEIIKFLISARWFKYDRDWFVCKQAALRSSCATLREWSHNPHPPSCSG